MLYARGRDVVDTKNLLEEMITPVSEWLLQRGLRILPEKCIFCPFSSKKVDLHNVFIDVDNTRVMGTSEMKYLGIILDSKLSWIPHIRKNILRACKAINVLKVISKVSLGAAAALALMVFRGLIRAYLECSECLGSRRFRQGPKFRLEGCVESHEHYPNSYIVISVRRDLNPSIVNLLT